MSAAEAAMSAGFWRKEEAADEDEDSDDGDSDANDGSDSTSDDEENDDAKDEAKEATSGGGNGGGPLSTGAVPKRETASSGLDWRSMRAQVR